MPLIASVSERMGGRTGAMDNLGRRKYTRRFTVETTDPLVGPLAVRTATGIPVVGSSYHNGVGSGDPRYEFDLGAFCESVSAAEEGDSGVEWVVTCEYGPFDWTPFLEEAALWPIRVSFGGERTERVDYFDNAGDPILNSAGDPFGDPVTVDDSRVVLTITRNEKVSTFSLAVPETFSDTINDAPWNGFAAKTCKMGVITTGEPTYDPNGKYYYYTVTYPVTIDRATWTKKILDQGFNELTGPYDDEVKPVMNNGQPVSDPVPLDGAGHRLDVYGTPVALDFEVYDEADWSALAIDLSTRLGA